MSRSGIRSDAARRALRRAARGLAIAPGALLLLVAVLLALVLGVQGVREAGLRAALRRIDANLPGEFAWSRLTWPEPWRLHVSGLLWTDGADTLASVDRLDLQFDGRALLQRDVVAEHLHLAGVFADLPRLQASLSRLPARADSTAASSGSFPREGALPRLPSLALRDVQLADVSLIVAPGLSVHDGKLAGSLTLRRGETPLARLDDVAARDAAGLWEIAGGTAEFDPHRGALTTRLDGASGNWPFALAVDFDGVESYRLTLAGRDGPAPPQGTGLVATGQLLRADGAVTSLTLEAQARTPGTAELAGMRGRPVLPEGWVDQTGMLLHATGRYVLLPTREGNLLVWTPSAVAGDSLRAAFSFQGTQARLDTLTAAWQGLVVRGSGRLADDTLAANLAASVRGTDWLRVLIPQFAAPDSLAADLVADLAGPLRALVLDASLDGALRQGDFRLESARLTATGLLAPPGSPLAFTLAARALGFDLSGDGEASLGDTLLVTLPPWRLAAVPGGPRDHRAALARLHAMEPPPVPGAGPASGTVSFVPATGALRASGLQIAFDEDRVQIEIEGALPSADDPERGVDLRATLHAPGPGYLSPLLPPQPAARTLGPLIGEVTLAALPDVDPGDFALRADLGATAWLDTALAVVHRRGATTVVKTLTFALPGLALHGSGDATPDSLDFALQLAVTDARSLRHFVLALDESAQVALTADVVLVGPTRAPRGSARLQGAVVNGSLVLPALEGAVDWTGARLLFARLTAPQGLTAGTTVLTTVEAFYGDEADTLRSSPDALVVRVVGEGMSLLQRAQVERAPGAWVVRTDTLAVVLSGRDLRSRGPFVLELLDGGAGLRLRDLDLAGEMGSVRGAGHAGPDSTRLEFDAELALPAAPPVPLWPGDLWPHAVAVHLRADADSASLLARVEGLRLGERDALVADLTLTGGLDGARGLLTVGDGGGEIARAVAALPATVQVWPPAIAVHDGDLSATLDLDDFPLIAPTWGRAWQGPVPLLDGRVELTGPAAAPALGARLRLAFPSHGGEGGHEADIAARLQAPGAATPAVPTSTFPPGGAAETPPEAPGALGVAWTISRDGAEAGRGDLHLPLVWKPGPPALPTAPGDSITANFQARDLSLSDLNYLLAGEASLEGRLTLDIAAAGPTRDPRLTGNLAVAKLGARLADGTWALGAGEMKLSGTGRHPALRGNVRIDQGVLVVPEVRAALLPIEGTATLWREAAHDTRAASQVPAPAAAEPVLQALDLELGLSIPSGFWIRGRGLDVELAGDLEVRQGEGAPAVFGDLAATRGQLTLLDRTFIVERGRTIFYGGAVVDPEIDLVLAAQQDDLLVRVNMTGTVMQPELRLTSEPELTEGDIMARLVFGRPLDQLDEKETGMLQSRAVSVARTFTTSRIEAMLSRQLGVDMLRFTAGETGGRALMVGKYLNRRTLLRYEQSLQSEQVFSLGLEYWLARRFKLETSFSRATQSGLDLKWSRNY